MSSKSVSSGDAGDSKLGGNRKDLLKAEDGNNRSFHDKNKHHALKKPALRQPKFEGKCDDLKGHIYDCSNSRQVDIFAKTTKEFAEHVGRTYRYGTGVQRAIQQMAIPTIKKPEDPPEKASKTDMAIWTNEVLTYVRRRAAMNEALEKVFPLILGQCTDSMRAKLEGFNEYEAIARDFNTIGLIKLIKSTVYKFQSQRHPGLSIHTAKRHFYLLKQDKHTGNNDYLDMFSNNTDVIKHIGGIIGEEPTLLKIELGKLEVTAATTAAKQQYLAIAFLCGSDRTQYGKLLEDLENSYLQGRDKYPATLTSFGQNIRVPDEISR
jgi:hypothetical protein